MWIYPVAAVFGALKNNMDNVPLKFKIYKYAQIHQYINT